MADLKKIETEIKKYEKAGEIGLDEKIELTEKLFQVDEIIASLHERIADIAEALVEEEVEPPVKKLGGITVREAEKKSEILDDLIKGMSVDAVSKKHRKADIVLAHEQSQAETPKRKTEKLLLEAIVKKLGL